MFPLPTPKQLERFSNEIYSTGERKVGQMSRYIAINWPKIIAGLYTNWWIQLMIKIKNANDLSCYIRSRHPPNDLLIIKKTYISTCVCVFRYICVYAYVWLDLCDKQLKRLYNLSVFQLFYLFPLRKWKNHRRPAVPLSPNISLRTKRKLIPRHRHSLRHRHWNRRKSVQVSANNFNYYSNFSGRFSILSFCTEVSNFYEFYAVFPPE